MKYAELSESDNWDVLTPQERKLARHLIFKLTPITGPFHPVNARHTIVWEEATQDTRATDLWCRIYVRNIPKYEANAGRIFLVYGERDDDDAGLVKTVCDEAMKVIDSLTPAISRKEFNEGKNTSSFMIELRSAHL